MSLEVTDKEFRKLGSAHESPVIITSGRQTTPQRYRW